MKYRLKFHALLFLTSLPVFSQPGSFPLTNYTTRDYGKDFQPANMAVVQDSRGLIYAANGFKLLEYDGNGWRSYPINRETWILSLAIDRRGVIYAGSQNEFGCFSPDQNGDLRYHSFSDTLASGSAEFSNIWKVHALADRVVFQAEEALFILRKGHLSIVKPGSSFHTSFNVNNHLFVRERGKGILELRGEILEKIRGSEVFDTTGIFFMVPLRKAEGSILIGTREKGFWLMRENNGAYTFNRIHPAAEKMIEQGVITSGVSCPDGSVAIGTMKKGIVIIDESGNLITIVDKSKGLADNEVKDIISDREGNLWAALNNGISRIGISSPLTYLDEKEGITGSINSLARHNDLLWVGTGSGLQVQDVAGKSLLQFRPVKELSVPVRSLTNAEGSLVAGTDAGLYEVNGNLVRKIDNEESFSLLWIPEFKLLLSGGSKGLRAFTKNPTFRKVNYLTIADEDIIGISRGDQGNSGTIEIWLGTRYKGVIRLKITAGLTFVSESFGSQDGLPAGPVIPALLEGRPVFETSSGIYGFTDENSVRESLPDSLKNNKNFIKGFFSPFKSISSEAGASASCISQFGDRVWLCIDNNLGYLDRNDSLKLVSVPFRGVESGKINLIYPDMNNICWVGTTDGLIRYDGNMKKNYNIDYLSLIRNVNLPDRDSVLFHGNAFSSDSGFVKIVSDQPAAKKPVLNYRNNSLRFDFSATFYEYLGKTLYSGRLIGRSAKWNQWSRETFQEFTNLREGDYTFQVRAKNIYGTESEVASYSFTILSPWYRTTIAYLLYIVAGIILLWLSARLYSYRLKRENIRLEGIISERTAEIVRQKDEILEKNTVLEHQKKEIEDSIRYAKRIQTAVLPSEEVCRELLPESFVFFRPLNIVSGDFYWISRTGDKIIYTAADCTGHGVPGAFMSMLGVAFLNEIVNKDNITSPDKVLKHLRDKVIGALQQHGASGEARDGMDISLVSIDTHSGMLEFAGAYNPVIMIRRGELTETSGDKMPIGIYENMQEFTKHGVALEKGDAIYMYSDGYEDQFGGPDGKKFKSKRLKNLLTEICTQPAVEQKLILEKTFDDWKGDLPQVDDIVVIGIIIQ